MTRCKTHFSPTVSSKTASSKIVFGVCVALLLVVLNGCSEGDDTTNAGDNTFSVYISEPHSILPTNNNESDGNQVIESLFTGLVSYDADTFEIVYEIAESIESEDQKIWTISLKNDWTFHNGEPVTAQSFVDTWNYAAFGPNAQKNSHHFSIIDGYEELQCAPEECTTTTLSGMRVTGSHTFEVRLTEAFSQFPLMLGYTGFFPMPKAAFADIKAYETAPIGNGPFMMQGKWEHDTKITTKKYPDYAGNPAQADGINFKIYSLPETAFLDMQSGNLDITKRIPPELIKEARKEFGDRTIETPNSYFQYLGFPLYDERFRNPDLRRAFSMAIDRDAISEMLFAGTHLPARSIVSPLIPGARPDACGEACRFAPEAARALLQAAGGFDGPLEIWYDNDHNHQLWVEAVANQLRTNLGITDIVFKVLPFPEFISRLYAKNITGLFSLGWSMDFPSLQNYLQPMYHSGSHPPMGVNLTTYANPEVDQMLDAGNRAASSKESLRFYQKAEDLILADLPTIPIYYGSNQGAHSTRVENVRIDAFRRIRVTSVHVR